MHLDFEPSAPTLTDIEFSKFLEIDMRIGEVVEVTDFPEARKPSYKLKIDFGARVGIKKSSAQITVNYKKEDLVLFNLDKEVPNGSRLH